ncbi:MAG: class I tRNA ligase family protein [Syntrophobacteraceae bacterium]
MLQLLNTMTREKEPFEPRSGRTVKMFSCGPSIYRRPHVGNYRSFIWQDALVRYLEYLGYSVKRALNFTDVEDKAISEAAGEGLTIGELTGAVAERFFEEARGLRMKLPEKIPRSSTSVEQAVRIIRKLVRKGYAYWREGDVFFDPLKFEGFGKLFRLDMSKWPKQKRRFKKDTYPGQRWNLGDFILWHGYRDGDYVFWETDIGKGRPSWNVQDPAMISECLGYSLDIFCGGIDNLYRHHDYNIAVMESASGKELARYWLHGHHVLVRGKKMSKSLDNIVYTEDLLAQGYTWEHIRFYLLHAHYRKRLNLTMESFRETCGKLDALRSMVNDITAGGADKRAAPDGATEKLAGEITSRFESAMNDDLDTRGALDGVSRAVSGLHARWKAGRIAPQQAAGIKERLRKVDGVLQVIFDL